MVAPPSAVQSPPSRSSSAGSVDTSSGSGSGVTGSFGRSGGQSSSAPCLDITGDAGRSRGAHEHAPSWSDGTHPGVPGRARPTHGRPRLSDPSDLRTALSVLAAGGRPPRITRGRCCRAAPMRRCFATPTGYGARRGATKRPTRRLRLTRSGWTSRWRAGSGCVTSANWQRRHHLPNRRARPARARRGAWAVLILSVCERALRQPRSVGCRPWAT